MVQLDEFRHPHLTKKKCAEMTNGFLRPRTKEIKRMLRTLGANSYDLSLPETKELPLAIKFDEQITGIVYGRYINKNEKVDGRAVIVATDHRIILFERKPLYLQSVEMGYGEVSAAAYNQSLIPSRVILRTKHRDFHLRTFNRKCARNIVSAIEAARNQHSQNKINKPVRHRKSTPKRTYNIRSSTVHITQRQADI